MGWFDSFDINSIINPETIKNQVGGDGIKLATGQMSIEDAAKKGITNSLTGGMEVPGTDLNATLSSQPDLLGKIDSGIAGQGTIEIPTNSYRSRRKTMCSDRKTLKNLSLPYLAASWLAK